MDGKGLGQIFLAEVKRCLAESWFLDIWEPPGGFRLEAFTCFVMLKLELAPFGGFPGGGPRIWADGFIRSSHRRIQLPRFRPTSMSLSCMLWWTLSATSNTARVRLQNGGAGGGERSDTCFSRTKTIASSSKPVTNATTLVIYLNTLCQYRITIIIEYC